MTFNKSKKRMLALILMAVLFLCPILCPAEETTAAVSAEETLSPSETLAAEETVLPETVEPTPAPSSLPETSPSTVSDAGETLQQTPNTTASPAAQKEETPPPFTEGYVWAPEDTCLYTRRDRSDDALLVRLPYSLHLYVKECRGNWAELIVALRTEEGVQVMEAYAPLYHLELLDAADQADAAASVFSKAHTDHHGIMIRIISLVDRVAEPTPEVTEVPAEETVPETTEVPAEETVPEITEVPAEETVPETTEVPAEENAPETTDVPAEETVPEASVSIRTHADSPVHIGDSVTLEAVAEGFDHEPVFFWEFRLPDSDKWYPFEEESGSTLTFIVNRYNCEYIWRVTAE